MNGWRLSGVAALLALAWPVLGLAQTNSAQIADSAEAPELGRRGTASIGTTYLEVTFPMRSRLSAQGPKLEPRQVGLRIWYPALASTAPGVVYRHTVSVPGGARHSLVEAGLAVEAAAPAKGPFPLVMVSHGFGGWSEQLSRLGEHLASRGYVVVSIDHRDAAFTSLPEFYMSFGNVVLDRAKDQREVIERLLDRSFGKAQPALAGADPSRLALIGYSMGGFGALATAGAAYDVTAKPFAALPEALRNDVVRPDARTAALVRALILIAPWGGQPDNRAWRAEQLATLRKPVLMISGDQDDIVNFAQGVRWLFESLTNADRHLLVYREARHNVAGNAVDLGATPGPDVIGFTREPVWRQERINQINQHFVTAFLDANLKGDASKRAYLDVAPLNANDAKWTAKPGARGSGGYAGDGQPSYWRGFRERWAIGLEMHRKRSGQ